MPVVLFPACAGVILWAAQEELRHELFPAGAGVILAEAIMALDLEAFPRMCGGDHTKKVCDI